MLSPLQSKNKIIFFNLDYGKSMYSDTWYKHFICIQNTTLTQVRHNSSCNTNVMYIQTMFLIIVQAGWDVNHERGSCKNYSTMFILLRLILFSAYLKFLMKTFY